MRSPSTGATAAATRPPAPAPSEQVVLIQLSENDARPKGISRDRETASTVEQECCAICLGSLVDPQPFPNADCPHTFCSTCLSTLHRHHEHSVVLHVSCPKCRRPSSLVTEHERESTRTLEQRQEHMAYNDMHDKRVLTFIAITAITMCVACGVVVDAVVNRVVTEPLSDGSS